jgi:hypothetical protein
MIIERKPSGFYEWDAELRLRRPRALGMESGRVEQCMTRYNEDDFCGIFGSPHFGFREENLDFLQRATRKPTWLWFWDVELKNIEALYGLDEIDEFGINPKRPGIDFSRFRRMGVVVNHWLKQDTGIANAAIREYNLWHFKPRSQSFADVEIPLAVERLELYWANPSSLTGLPVLNELTELQIHRCRNLANLSALPHIAPNLRHLLATTSSRLVPEAGVLDHPKLQTARIDGKELLAPKG